MGKMKQEFVKMNFYWTKWYKIRFKKRSKVLSFNLDIHVNEDHFKNLS